MPSQTHTHINTLRSPTKMLSWNPYLYVREVVQICVDPELATLVSVSSCKFCSVELNDFVLLVSSITYISITLLPSLLCGFPYIWEDLVETHHLLLSVPSSSSFFAMSGCEVSEIVPIYCRRELICWWLNKALIYEYWRLSLVVILSLLF